MKNLLYKELNLSINKFYYILPLLLSLLFFIPQWIYSFVFMYFFWISVSQIFVGFTAQRDYSFNSMLPVTKKDIVTSKSIAYFLIELLHLLFGIIFGVIHNLIYGVPNFLMDINPAFFGIMFMMFGLFNIIFLPIYFKTAYKFGKATIYGVVITLLFAAFFELGSLKLPFVRNIVESSNTLVQIGILMIGIVTFIVLSVISVRQSITNYENIQ